MQCEQRSVKNCRTCVWEVPNKFFKIKKNLYMIDDKFNSTREVSKEDGIGIWHGCWHVRHGNDFIIEVPMLHL